MRVSDHKPRCRAHNLHGEQCAKLSVPGGKVCRYHGGRAPQVLASAEQRMRDLIPPALDSLRRQIDKDEFPATRYVLDWAGFKAADKLEGTGEVTIRIVHEDQPITTLDVPYAQLNGHASNGHTAND